MAVSDMQAAASLENFLNAGFRPSAPPERKAQYIDNCKLFLWRTNIDPIKTSPHRP
ncbi:hypothetical protein Q6A51_24305 [Pseudomonas sp. KFB-139]|uniref:Integrase n=1 Tax=Pseudomonas serbiensis TaxID=3064350 RepID=A0ABT9CWM6_9PSED|nr:hypothetical protein [Pseudomonas sp. KFB-138]MDO7929904.1 hypothetical protein [Pseudomonas sp. KFB-138]